MKKDKRSNQALSNELSVIGRPASLTKSSTVCLPSNTHSCLSSDLKYLQIAATTPPISTPSTCKFNDFSNSHPTGKTMRIHYDIWINTTVRKRHVLLWLFEIVHGMYGNWHRRSVFPEFLRQTWAMIAPQTPFWPWRLANLNERNIKLPQCAFLCTCLQLQVDDIVGPSLWQGIGQFHLQWVAHDPPHLG